MRCNASIWMTRRSGIRMARRTYRTSHSSIAAGRPCRSRSPATASIPPMKRQSVELKYDKPVVRTLGNENTTALRVTLSVPQLTYQNPETGDLSGSSVEFRIETQSAGGGFVTRVQDTIA